LTVCLSFSTIEQGYERFKQITASSGARSPLRAALVCGSCYFKLFISQWFWQLQNFYQP